MYDDECGFCTWFVEWALRHGEFEPVGFAELSPEQRARLPDDYEECMHLLTDDAVYSCGTAAERIIELSTSGAAPLLRVLRRVPGYPDSRDALYRWLADYRDVWGRYRSASPPASR